MRVPIIQAFVLALVVFMCSYLVILYAIDFFIYRKIKVIYKTISDIKGLKFNMMVQDDMRKGDPIAEVDNEVKTWALSKVKEIEQLKVMEKYRKEFFGNVAHELKTPIFNLQGYIHSILDSNIEDPDVAMHFLNKAAKSADRMELLVKDLLSIAELESGTVEMELEQFDIYELMQDVIDSLELKASEKNIVLSFKPGISPPFIVEGDKKRIRQVLVNLIVNSIKYGKEGGSTNVGIYDMDTNFLLEVSDTGEGIAKEHLARLFERFYRVDKARSRDAGGTGLGLSIVKHIVEAHNQTISVRSTLGEGSTFGITLKKAAKK